jgi:bacterial/archaeal transporter family-2 protein
MLTFVGRGDWVYNQERGNSMGWLLWLVALCAGAANPFQSGTNAELNRQSGQPLWTALAVYASGLAGLLVLHAIFRPAFPTPAKIRDIHGWAWLGGLISIGPTLAGLTLAQKLGSGVFTGLTITAAIITSVLIDHFGLIGFRYHPASPERFIGCSLMVAGVWLVMRT